MQLWSVASIGYIRLSHCRASPSDPVGCIELYTALQRGGDRRLTAARLISGSAGSAVPPAVRPPPILLSFSWTQAGISGRPSWPPRHIAPRRSFVATRAQRCGPGTECSPPGPPSSSTLSSGQPGSLQNFIHLEISIGRQDGTS